MATNKKTATSKTNKKAATTTNVKKAKPPTIVKETPEPVIVELKPNDEETRNRYEILDAEIKALALERKVSQKVCQDAIKKAIAEHRAYVKNIYNPTRKAIFKKFKESVVRTYTKKPKIETAVITKTETETPPPPPPPPTPKTAANEYIAPGLNDE